MYKLNPVHVAQTPTCVNIQIRVQTFPNNCKDFSFKLFDFSAFIVLQCKMEKKQEKLKYWTGECPFICWKHSSMDGDHQTCSGLCSTPGPLLLSWLVLAEVLGSVPCWKVTQSNPSHPLMMLTPPCFWCLDSFGPDAPLNKAKKFNLVFIQRREFQLLKSLISGVKRKKHLRDD